MSLIETPLMRGLERVLDLSAFRHQIIAANLANVDTPGYHTRDLRQFAGDIERAMAGAEGSPDGSDFIVDGKYGLRITDIVDAAPAAMSPG